MTRPARLIVVAGTGTEIGKTWVASRVLEAARAEGLRVAARKPVQSFDPNSQALTDADQLAQATGETPQVICPKHRWYPVAMAPPMAADVLGRERILLDALLSEINWPVDIELGCVETAGGLRSPIAHDADNVELIRRLAPESVLLIADAGLGTINSVRMSVDALGQQCTRVFLNRFDAGNDLHVRNREWLIDVYGCTVITQSAQWLALERIISDQAS
jgi:dethiobiotin synthetase